MIAQKQRYKKFVELIDSSEIGVELTLTFDDQLDCCSNPKF